MKLHQIVPILGGILLTGLLAAILIQHRRSNDLGDADGRETAHSAEPTAQPPLSPASSAPLTDAEHRELLQLRRDVGQLRRERPDLDRLRAAQDRLRAALTNATAPAADGTPAFLNARTARYLGLATPTDTLESFLFAARSRDTNVLFRVLTPASVAMMAGVIENQGGDAALNELGWIPGFRIDTLTEKPDGTAEVGLRFDPRPGSDPQSLKLERINGEWRLSLL